MGLGRAGQRRMALEERLERDLAEFQRLGRPRDDHLVDLVVGLGQRGLERRLHRAADDRRLGAGMLEHVGVVVGGEQRIDRDRDGAGEDRAEERDRPVAAIEHEDEHPLLALDAGVLQRRGEAANALVELAVGEPPLVVDEGGLVRPAGVGVQQMPGEIERLRRRLDARDHCSSRLVVLAVQAN